MIAAAVTESPALPVVWEWLLLTSVVLGIACTVLAFRLVSKGIMRRRGAVGVLLLNFVPVVGPVVAALGLAWGVTRSSERRAVALDGPR